MGAGSNANAQAIYQGLMRSGLRPHQAAGFLGNFMEESSLNPKAWNKGEAAGGLAQWRGPRLEALKSFAGDKINDLGTQAEFAVHEMRTNPAYRNSWALLQNARNADDAARAVTTWEKPAGYNPKTNDPSGVPSMNDRIGHARSFLSQLGGGGDNTLIGGSGGDTLQGGTKPPEQSPDFVGPPIPQAVMDAEAAKNKPGSFMGQDAAIREGGGLIGMANSPEGITGAGLKTFMGGAEMKGAMGGLGMLAGALGGGGTAAPAPQQMTVEDHAPDMSMLQLLMNKRKNAMVDG